MTIQQRDPALGDREELGVALDADARVADRARGRDRRAAAHERVEYDAAPERQGRGWGSRLMRPILERADRERRAVTLETAQPRNLPLYVRHGFAVTRELPPPAPGGPTVWTMKRPPRREG